MNRVGFLLVLLLIGIHASDAQIKFENRAAALGVDTALGTTIILGGTGVSFYDFDGDGWDDITFASTSGQNLKFFKNNNGTFSEVTLNFPGVNYQTKQINWVDIDNDGDKDLFVTSDTNGNRLYENTGNLNFQDITIAAGLPTQNFFTSGASWGDYNNDGFLDVFVSNIDPSVATQTPNYLYKNNGDGTFTDVSVSAGIDRLHHLSFCSAFMDYNNDGWQDIYIANDRLTNRNQMYRNNGDGTFTEVGAQTNSDVLLNAMTTTVGDFNNDGWQDIYVTNIGQSALLKNNGNGTFTDVVIQTGTTFDSFAWGAVFLDADNDKDLDLYVSGSLVNIPNNRSAAFYENRLETGNEFFVIPTTAGFDNDEGHSYSNAVGDINNDGLPDFVVTNNENEKVFLWENQTTTSNNWLKISLEGTSSNKDGIGARIEVTAGGEKFYRYTHSGEGYLSQNSSYEFIGLGSHTTVDEIKVTWLGGNVDVFTNVPANRALQVVEGSNTLSVTDVSKSVKVIGLNPVKDRLMLKSEYTIQGIEIRDILGKIVYRSTLYNEQGLDVSHLKPGVYFMNMSVNGTLERMKVLKN